jgi:hypothetical protein
VNARIIFAEIWRKKMDAMKESERTRTMKGSLSNVNIVTQMRRSSIIRTTDIDKTREEGEDGSAYGAYVRNKKDVHAKAR